MKKILASLFIFMTAILLVACGDGYKEVNLTSAQISELLTNLEFTRVDQSTKEMINFVLKGDGEFENIEQVYDPETGTFNTVRTLTNLVADIDMSAYAAVGAELEDLLLMLDVEKFLLTVNNAGEKVSVKANNNQLFHGGDGYIYANLNLEMSEGSTKTTFEGKFKNDEAIPADEYRDFVKGLEEGLVVGEAGFNFNDFINDENVQQLIDIFDLKISQSGNSYKLNMNLDRDAIIDPIMELIFGFTIDMENMPPEVKAQIEELVNTIKAMIKKLDFAFELIITNNRVVQTTIEASINIDTTGLESNMDLSIPSIKLNLETFKLVMKNTTEDVKIPTDLNTYTKSFNELPLG